jgi:hypothetical protein
MLLNILISKNYAFLVAAFLLLSSANLVLNANLFWLLSLALET